ncbi:MAG: hypothetical protein Q8942_06875 [Bacillota bacterium]|nr:hypothetical protein [Bacillota bacterium]
MKNYPGKEKRVWTLFFPFKELFSAENCFYYRNSFLGGILYFIVEKAVNKGVKSVTYPSDKELNSSVASDAGNLDLNKSLFHGSDKFQNISKIAIMSVVKILKIAGILFIILGSILIMILFLAHFLF